jgi:hypothetical protein
MSGGDIESYTGGLTVFTSARGGLVLIGLRPERLLKPSFAESYQFRHDVREDEKNCPLFLASPGD